MLRSAYLGRTEAMGHDQDAHKDRVDLWLYLDGNRLAQDSCTLLATILTALHCGPNVLSVVGPSHQPQKSRGLCIRLAM